MITSFGIVSGPMASSNGGDKTTTDTNTIVSIHLADYSNDCSKHNHHASIKSFESITNDGKIAITMYLLLMYLMLLVR